MSEPIWDEAAERAVLGCALLNTASFQDALSARVTAADFWQPSHGLIWQAMVGLWESGAKVDPLSVEKELHRRGDLTRAGGGPYLHMLISVDALPVASNVLAAVATVLEQAALRRALQAGLRIAQFAESGARGSDVATILEFVRREAEEACAERVTTSASMPVADALGPFIDSLDKPLAGVVPTPWPAADEKLLGGLRAGSLTVLAARSSTGKTLVAMNMARSAARSGTPTEFLSGEMTRDELMARLLSDVATVPWSHLMEHRLTEDDWQRVIRWSERIADWPLSIHDRLTGMSVAEIRAHCRQRARSGLGYLVIDQSSMIRPSDPRARPTDQYAQITADLKSLAQELEIPVVLLHQLNRGPMDRSDKRPSAASDLRDSDAIFFNADNIILLWRPPDTIGQMTLIVDKHRNGPTGDVDLRFEGIYARAVSPDPTRM